MQVPVVEPTSDDELQLMQLDGQGGIPAIAAQKSWWGPVNEKIAHMLLERLASKPLPQRIKKWKIREDQLQNLTDSPRATS
jgi:hypothetical protein